MVMTFVWGMSGLQKIVYSKTLSCIKMPVGVSMEKIRCALAILYSAHQKMLKVTSTGNIRYENNLVCTNHVVALIMLLHYRSRSEKRRNAVMLWDGTRNKGFGAHDGQPRQ